MNISRRHLIGYGSLGVMGAALSSMTTASAQTVKNSTSPTAPSALLTSGTYLNQPYELIVVDKPNGGLHMTRVEASTNQLAYNKARANLTYPASYVYTTPTQEAQKPYNAHHQVLFAGNTTQDKVFAGVQIKNGKKYQDHTVPGVKWDGGSIAPRGFHILGIKKDGTMKIYDNPHSDPASPDALTGDQLVKDGVVDTFTFSFALVRNGQKVDFNGPKNTWRDAYHKWFRQWSARTVIGNDKYGRPMVLVVHGHSQSTMDTTREPTNEPRDGLDLIQSMELAYSLGFHNAIVTDGGGSAQLTVNGELIHPSSDYKDGVNERNLPSYGALKDVKVVDQRKIPSSLIEDYVKRNNVTGPKSGFYPLGNGWAKDFENSRTVFYNPATRFTGEIHRGGRFWVNWRQQSPAIIGLPTSNKKYFPGSPDAHTQFMKRDMYYNASVDGAFSLVIGGGIIARWRQLGGMDKLGLPITDETLVLDSAGKSTGIIYQMFKKGHQLRALVWSPTHGQTYMMHGDGAFFNTFTSNPRRYGAPVMDEQRRSDGSYFIRFETGKTLTWYPNGRMVEK